MTEEEIAKIKKENEELQKKLADAGNDEEARKRLAFLEKEHKELIEARDKAKEEKRKAEEARLAEQGEFKSLYEGTKGELEALKARAEKAEAALTKFLDQETAAIPEDKRALIPEGDPASRLEWIGKAKAAGLFGTPAKAPGTRVPGENGEVKINPWKKETRNLTEQARIMREDPAMAERLKAAAGG